MPDPYITTDELTDFMRLSTEPDEADFAVAVACASVRSFLDQEISYHENDVYTRDGHANARIRLPERPVRFVSTLEIDGVELDPVTDYRVHLDTGIVKLLNNFFTTGLDNVEATYDHGWDTDALMDSGADVELLLPDDLKYWTLVIARRRLLSMGAIDREKISETIGIYAYTLDPLLLNAKLNLMPAEEEGLEHYAIRRKV